MKRRHRITSSVFMLKRKKVKSLKKLKILKNRTHKSVFSFSLFGIVTSYVDKAKVESPRFALMPKIWKLLALKNFATCVKSGRN